jgi:UDP-N-acetylglucosamine--N-acetylmuramyl-(pentapeptide) pyrophosphoryl-undecaprenol N-acetylglucosamine transferase
MATAGLRYLLTGGGTGGHVYPAIAIADELRRREQDAKFLYVGVRGKAEEQIVKKRGYELAFVSSRGWPGSRPSLALFRFALSLGWGILQALKILWIYKPNLIVATGGYVAAPIMLAWIILRRLHLTRAKAFVHEQNLMPGRLNQLVSKLANYVGVSFEQSRRYVPQARWVGYPARQEIGQMDRQTARELLGIDADAKVVLAFGGSQGARSINRAIIDALASLLRDPKVLVIHGVGRDRGGSYLPETDTLRRFEQLDLSSEQRKQYKMSAYLDPIEHYYAAADLAICRAGAGTLTELALCALPSVIIPKANLPGDHQVRNARALEQQGAIRLIYEKTQQTADGLIEIINGEEQASLLVKLLGDEQTCQQLGQQLKSITDPGATARIADLVQSIAVGEIIAQEAASGALPTSKDVELSDMGGAAIVTYIHRHGLHCISPDDRDYLAYRADGYLAHPSWQQRNIGVKLMGVLRLADRIDLLIFLLRDRTPAVWWHRLCGGDYRQVGFIRRNVIMAFQQIDIWNEQIHQALLEALSDPYFEVRSQAAQAIIHFADLISPTPNLLSALTHCCKDLAFEVRQYAYIALAHLETHAEVYDLLKADFMNVNWLIRDALIQAIHILVDRDVIPAAKVQADLEQILLTSAGFTPNFPLREQLQKLSLVLSQKTAK